MFSNSDTSSQSWATMCRNNGRQKFPLLDNNYLGHAAVSIGNSDTYTHALTGKYAKVFFAHDRVKSM
jgi:hypothetical protein